MKSSIDGATTVQRESAREHVAGYTDQTLIDAADAAKVGDLTDAWWADHEAEFALAFKEATPDCWPGIAKAKAAACDEAVADRLRDLYASGSIPLPEQFNDD